MGRKRVIDTDELLFDEELYEAVGKDGLWLYVRLWALAEDFGGYEPKFGTIALKTGVLKLSTEAVKKIIEKLIIIGKIITYCIDGKTYHWLRNFMKHQPLNNPTPPTLPLPPWIICEIKQYKSKKKYASYEIDLDILAKYTGSLPVVSRKEEIPVETETETETETDTIPPIVPLRGTIFSIQDLAGLWNEIAPPSLSRVHLPFSRSERDMVKIRKVVKRHPDMAWWEQIVLKLRHLPFVLGKNKRGWKITFDVMVRDAEQILDGKYAGGGPGEPRGFDGLRKWVKEGEQK